MSRASRFWFPVRHTIRRAVRQFVWWTAFAGMTALTRVAWATPASDQAQQHFLQGLAYERLGRLNESYSELQIASTLEPKDPQIALALGLVAVRFGRMEVAQRSLEQSIILQADSVGSYFELALLYESKGLTERALDAWHRFAGLSQDDVLKQLAQKHIQRLENP